MLPRQHCHRHKRTLGFTLFAGALSCMALLGGCTREADAEMTLQASINAIRTDAGVPPLRPDASLVQVARVRSADMAAHHYLGHKPPDGCDYVCLMGRQSVTYAYAGEIIASNTFGWGQSAAVAADAFAHSPGHLAKMLDCHYQRFGTGVSEAADGTIYFTTIFEGAAAC